MKTVPAWRIAWFAPLIGNWRLGVYEFQDYRDAETYRNWLETEWGFRCRLIATATRVTDHGVNG